MQIETIRAPRAWAARSASSTRGSSARRCGVKPGTSTVSAVGQRLQAGAGDDREARAGRDRPGRLRADGQPVRRLLVGPEDLRRDGEIERDDALEGEHGDVMVRGHWLDRNEQWHSCHSRRRAPGATILPMKIEIILFDGFDDLDAFGPFEVLTASGLQTEFVTVEPRELVVSAGGARIVPARRARRPGPGARPRRRLERPPRARHVRRGTPRRHHARTRRAPRRRRPHRLGLHRRDAARRGRPAHAAAPRSRTTARSRTCAASA